MATKKRRRKSPAKAYAPPKFVALAARSAHLEGGLIGVYALDSAGIVWQYDARHGEWVSFATTRRGFRFMKDEE
jgi:hypothetical protein